MIVITDSYVEGLRARVIPGARFDYDTKSWVLDSPTPRNALIALKLFPMLQLTNPELAEMRDSVAQDIRPFNYAERSGVYLEFPNVEAAMAEQARNLYDFQRTDLAYQTAVLTRHGSAYVGWERGLGKTIGALALIEGTGAQRVIVVSPNTAKATTWAPEWETYGKYLPHELVVLPNTKAKRDAQVERMINHPGPFVWVIHWESLNIIANMRSGRRGWKRFPRVDLVVADEARRLSNKKALQARSLKLIPTRLKVAMDGSIIMNHAGELYSQLNWLFPTRYRNEQRDWSDRFLDYVDLEGHREYIGVKLEVLDKLRDELGRFMVYRRKEDELDLPPITHQDLPVELSPSQRKTYDELADNAIAQLDTGEILAPANGLALLTQLRQVATGLDLVSDQLVDSAKVDVAAEIIRDNPDEGFVVFSWFRASADALGARLSAQGIPTFVVHGGVKKQADRADRVRRFMAGERRVIVATIKTLGDSVTLSRASNVIFLDRSWNPEDNNQATDRVAGGFRAIQAGRPITVTNLIAKDTVDETRVTPTLGNKAAVRAAILGASKR